MLLINSDSYGRCFMDEERHDTVIIALAGKGGVGKTSVAAAAVKALYEEFPDKRVLAIDADPAVGLSLALGVEVESTIDDIRKDIVSSVEAGDKRAAIELLGDARYKIFDAMTETEKFSFIAIGRPEDAGCYCKINSYLKEVISLLAKDFDFVVIDGEAGIEQINRRVMEKVTHLILVTDPSKKGTQVIKTIKEVADRLVMYRKVAAIVNRIVDPNLNALINTGDIPVAAYIPNDAEVSRADTAGRSIVSLGEDCRLISGVREALRNIGIISEKHNA